MLSILHIVIGVLVAGVSFGLLHVDILNSLQSFSMDSCNTAEFSKHAHGLGMDTAVLNVTSPFNVSVWTLSTACWKCNPTRQTLPSQTASLKLDTKFEQIISVVDEVHNRTLCNGSLTRRLVDQGVYSLQVSDDDCVWTLLNSPSNSDIPVYITIAVLFGVLLLWQVVKLLYSKGILSRLSFCLPSPDQLINSDLGRPLLNEDSSAAMLSTIPQKKRIHSVDTFRGLSLVIMIFVNYGGGGYWYFQHSAWNGLTVADVVFPWFVFLMGTSISISFRSALERGTARRTIFLKVIRRTIMLFFFGLAISNNGPNVSVYMLRIFGVLQRLAITFFVVAVVEVFSATSADQHVHKWWRGLRDLVPAWPMLLLAACVTATHLCLTFLLEVPGCPRGYLGPGGRHDGGKYENCTGGAAGYIDRIILTYNHMYRSPTCRRIYSCTEPYDPEGILGTLNTILLCVLGTQAGKILITYQNRKGMIHRWLVWGILTGILAGGLCAFRLEDGWIPVNKNLWSLSYVLAMASTAFFMLILLYIVVDGFNLWNGAPFVYPGMNSIVIYMCHEVFEEYFPIQFQVADSHGAQLAKNLWGTACWVIMSAIMYYKKIFVAL